MNLEKRGVLRRDTLSELVNLLRIRYTLSERVYYHHTKISSGAMISKAVELALQEGFRVEELRRLKDETLQFLLRQRFEKHPGIRHLLERLDSRRLYRACYTLTVEIGEECRCGHGLRRKHQRGPRTDDTGPRRDRRAIRSDEARADAVVRLRPIDVRLDDGAARNLARGDRRVNAANRGFLEMERRRRLLACAAGDHRALNQCDKDGRRHETCGRMLVHGEGSHKTPGRGPNRRYFK